MVSLCLTNVKHLLKSLLIIFKLEIKEISNVDHSCLDFSGGLISLKDLRFSIFLFSLLFWVRKVNMFCCKLDDGGLLIDAYLHLVRKKSS